MKTISEGLFSQSLRGFKSRNFKRLDTYQFIAGITAYSSCSLKWFKYNLLPS